MTTKKIQYNSKILECLHRPVTSSGFVLYPKVNGCTDTEEINTQAEADPIYQKQSQLTYNSPTNIRRVFITGQKIVVHYYKSIIKDGKPYGCLDAQRSYNGESIFDIAQKIFSYEQDMQAYQNEKTVNKNAVEPVRYSIAGNVLGVIANPYTCNNIEEVYFDWTALLSDDVLPFFASIFNDRSKLLACANGTTSFAAVNNNICLNLFAQSCLGGVKDIRKRFPRLRIIGLITNLEELRKAGACDIKNFGNETWFQRNVEIIQSTNNICIVSLLTDLKMSNKEFKLKPERFKFDAEVLKPYVQKYLESLKEKKANTPVEKSEQATGVEQATSKEPEEIGEFEAGVFNFVSQYGEQEVRRALMLVLSTRTKGEVTQLLDGVTTQNKKLISNLVYGGH